MWKLCVERSYLIYGDKSDNVIIIRIIKALKNLLLSFIQKNEARNDSLQNVCQEKNLLRRQFVDDQPQL